MTKTKTTFTPGPWRVSLHVRNAIRVYGGPTDRAICEIRTGVYADNLAAAANAHLIAAAPDMYAAGEAMIRLHNTYTGEAKNDDAISLAMSDMRAALRRARGEG